MGALLDPRVLVALALAALGSWGFYERSRYYECRTSAVSLEAQVRSLTGSLDHISGSVIATKAAGDHAVAETRRLVQEAQLLARAGAEAAARSEAAAKGPQQAGKTCADAWTEIEQARRP
jgi:peptidoglycan hydrolase CwlO-like protein